LAFGVSFLRFQKEMITTLLIRNFRSIRNANVTLGSMNALIGRNNAGKSNIMKALNLIVGDVYPSVRAFDEKDFFNYDKRNSILIQAQFDAPLAADSRVAGFRLTFNGTECEYVAINAGGSVVTYGPGRELRVNNDMREEVALMYLGLERQASQQLRVTTWTLYGKLLRQVDKQISETKKADFRTGIEQTYNTNIRPDLQQMEDILRNHVKRQTGLDLQLRLSVVDPIETLKNLRPYLRDAAGREFDAEDMGAGTQSALAIAIARAYSEIVRRPLILAIEEPELYLHPHGCRHFRKLLQELAGSGVQVIYTTHERSFIDLAQFHNVHLIRKDADETAVYSAVGRPTPAGDNFRVISKFDDKVNEVFFASKVVLVEGPADRIACQLGLENLGVEVDRESISITECGGIGDIKAIATVLKFFKIPVYVLTDEDPGNRNTEKIIGELKDLLGENVVFLQRPNLEGVLGLTEKPNKAEAMKILPHQFEEREVPQVYRDLKAALS
jgi:putative ATP-dependent endonuclease of the OLD family